MHLRRIRKLTLLLLLATIGVLPGPMAVWADPGSYDFKPLRHRLVQLGFDTAKIDAIYRHDDVVFDTRSVSLFFVHSEARLNYGRFLKSDSIRRAKAYLQRHSRALGQAQAAYGVSKEVITAIILIETQLGQILGRSSVLNVLSTMASLSGQKTRKWLWEAIPETRRISRQKFESKADRKSKWAFRELQALLTYTEREGLDPILIRGSYAGAMGICQFMPSNIDRLAIDGNRDGRVDLFDHEDAIASVANYLKYHGWRPQLSRQRAMRVVKRYNYSTPYAKTVLQVADLLKG